VVKRKETQKKEKEKVTNLRDPWWSYVLSYGILTAFWVLVYWLANLIF